MKTYILFVTILFGAKSQDRIELKNGSVITDTIKSVHFWGVKTTTKTVNFYVINSILTKSDSVVKQIQFELPSVKSLKRSDGIYIYEVHKTPPRRMDETDSREFEVSFGLHSHILNDFSGYEFLLNSTSFLIDNFIIHFALNFGGFPIETQEDGDSNNFVALGLGYNFYEMNILLRMNKSHVKRVSGVVTTFSFQINQHIELSDAVSLVVGASLNSIPKRKDLVYKKFFNNKPQTLEPQKEFSSIYLNLGLNIRVR